MSRDGLRSAFWLIPAVALLGGVLAGFGLPQLDEHLDRSSDGFAFGGEPPAARAMLEAIATVTVSLVGVSFSVTLVALQLASQQLSPRVLRTFRADRLNQATLGAFLATAVYTLLVLRDVRAEQEFVPGISVTVAIAATVLCLLLFVAFVNNIVVSLQPTTVIGRVREDGQRAIERARLREDSRRRAAPAPDAGGERVCADVSGFLQEVEIDELVTRLAEHGAVARQLVPIGDFVLTGLPLAELYAPAGLTDDLADRVRAGFRLGRERTTVLDPAFPIRQLSDIALRALSPSLNDPTTAENALDSIGDLLVRAAAVDLGSRAVPDDSGVVRFTTFEPTLDDLIRLAFEQVRPSVKGDPVLAVRVLKILALVRAAGGTGGGEAERQAEQLRLTFADAPLAADRERVDSAWRTGFDQP